MLKARKGNRVLRIPDEKKAAYIALGYTITDLEGNIIHEHVEPTEKLAELEKENEDLKAKLDEAAKYAESADKKIAELEKENEDLKAKLDEAAKYAESADKKIAELEKENEDLKAANKPANDESKTKKVAKAPSDTQK